MSDEEPKNESDDRVEQLLRLLARSERLESLPRTGWLVCGVQGPESIAAHLWETTLVAMWLADHVDEEVDTEKVLRISLLHDISESMLTDLPWPVKRFVGGDAIAEAEERATDEVLADAPDAWREAVAAYEQAESLEARIVKSADRIQMLAKSLQYDTQNRGDVRRFWREPRNFKDYGIDLVGEVLERLRERWEAGEWYPAHFD
ncbi:MAG: HD domain-containing protein [Persicimonas sp.]